MAARDRGRVLPSRTLRRALREARAWTGRQERVVLVSACAIVLALIGFAHIAGEMLEGETKDFDLWLLRVLRHPEHPEIPVGPAWLLQGALDITALGGRIVLTLAVLLVCGYLLLERKYGAMGMVAVAAASGGVLSTALKILFSRARPDVVPPLSLATSPSFPSGHSMLAAIVYLTLGALLARFTAQRRVKVYVLTVALLLAVLVGGSRVYLGVHYPTDVIAGWLAGLAWALLCWLAARYLQSRGTIEPPTE